ncbi:hypothetical protein FKG94_01050 [Exilibacterium tricleocarpae]|uniref:Uncharacterized protein n=1 Tax=Exilibacterium tricleocarpae TaxID=2591008 RepID=A0A545U9M0_9GAMM|nr:hypothetical protein [Exilibacterium tricleocarpae]TQV86172.1 hypothetical protein FKG94_01050 [Exilibacterium tricleocarpae]
MLKREHYIDWLPGLSALMRRLSAALAGQGGSPHHKNLLLLAVLAVFLLPALLMSVLDTALPYSSDAALLGWPLLAIGDMPRGWISIGVAPVGLIAIGAAPIGVVSLGGLALGLVSLGGIGVGLLMAVGGVAVGPYALGGISVGLYAGGGCALGYFYADGRQYEKLL